MAKGYREVGLAYLSDGNPTFALRELLKAEELIPNDHMTQYGLGIAYMSKDALDQAIVHFEKSIELKPDYAPATNSLGAAYMKKGQWDDAIRVFKQLTANLLYSTPHFPLYNIGRAYFYKKDYSASATYYNKALKYYNDGLAQSGVERKVRSDIMTYLHGALLPKVDRTTMANSLEGRAPFLDQKLMEYAAALPTGLKFGDGTLKYHLKKVLKDILPHELLWRQKQGFGVPVGEWFKKDLYEFTRGILLSEKAASRELFDMKYVGKILEEHRTGKQNHHHRLWTLLCLELWYMTFIDRGDITQGPLSL